MLRVCNAQDLGTPSGLSLAICFWQKSRNEYSNLWTLAQSELHFLAPVLSALFAGFSELSVVWLQTNTKLHGVKT